MTGEVWTAGCFANDVWNCVERIVPLVDGFRRGRTDRVLTMVCVQFDDCWLTRCFHTLVEVDCCGVKTLVITSEWAQTVNVGHVPSRRPFRAAIIVTRRRIAAQLDAAMKSNPTDSIRTVDTSISDATLWSHLANRTRTVISRRQVRAKRNDYRSKESITVVVVVARGVATYRHTFGHNSMNIIYRSEVMKGDIIER